MPAIRHEKNRPLAITRSCRMSYRVMTLVDGQAGRCGSAGIHGPEQTFRRGWFGSAGKMIQEYRLTALELQDMRILVGYRVVEGERRYVGGFRSSPIL